MELKRLAGEPGKDPGEMVAINKVEESMNQGETKGVSSRAGSEDSVTRKSLDDILIDFITRRGKK